MQEKQFMGKKRGTRDDRSAGKREENGNANGKLEQSKGMLAYFSYVFVVQNKIFCRNIEYI